MFFLQLRNELWKLFGKKRTYIGFLMFFVAQSAVIVGLHYSKGATQRLMRTMDVSGFPVEHFLTNLTIATITLVATALLLLPLYVALVGGDLVAKEAEDGTLRMILARPISRFRLLMTKWAAGLIFSFLLIMFFGIFAALFARLFYPAGGLFVFLPMEGVFSGFNDTLGWQHYLAAHLVLTVKAATIMTLAFMFSCFDIKPAAATILAISMVFINKILQDIPYFHDWQEWFFTYHLDVWANLFMQPVPWWRVGESLSILVGYNVSFLVIGCTAFQMRDIKS
jgi:ABC-2 type transport system permease protein